MKVSNRSAPPNLPSRAVARLEGHEQPCQAIVFSEDGRYCLTASHDRTVRLWNPARLDPAHPPGRELPDPMDGSMAYTALPEALPIQTYTDGITYAVNDVAMDSQVLLTASDKTLVVLDVVTQKVRRKFTGHHLARINAVTMGPDVWLSASYDATVRIWDAKSRSSEPIQVLTDAKDSVTSVLVHEDVIWTASVDGVVRSYDVRQGRLRADACHSPITDLALTRDAQNVAANCLSGTLYLIDVDTGTLANTYSQEHSAGQYGLPCRVTADDATIVTGSEDGKVVLYDLVRATCIQTLLGHNRPTCALATHPKDASVVVSAGYDGKVVVWASGDEYIGWK